MLENLFAIVIVSFLLLKQIPEINKPAKEEKFVLIQDLGI